MESASNLGLYQNFHKRAEAGLQGIGVVAPGKGWGRGLTKGSKVRPALLPCRVPVLLGGLGFIEPEDPKPPYCVPQGTGSPREWHLRRGVSEFGGPKAVPILLPRKMMAPRAPS